MTGSSTKGRSFPTFMCGAANAVAEAPPGMTGYMYEGAGGEQVVLWENKSGGVSPPHAHDFAEYAVVIEGTFDGRIGDEIIHLGPGDECFIPPGVVHEGRYSTNYRAIDVFGGTRVRRAMPAPPPRQPVALSELYTERELRDRLGLSTMALKNGADPSLGVDFDMLQRLVPHGYRRIEVGADYGPSHFDYHDLDAVRRTRKQYEDCGAAIYSIHAPYGYLPVVAGQPESKWNLNETEPAKVEAVFEDLKQLVEAMAVAGAEVLLVHFTTWGKAQWQFHLEVLGRVVELLRPHGIRLVIEAMADMTQAAHLVDWFEFPRVGLACDVSHSGERYDGVNLMADRANVRRVFSTARGKLTHLHLSDTSDIPLPRSHPTKPLKPKRGHWSPGRGSDHWAGIFAELKAIDYPGCFMFEVLSTDPQRFERLAAFPAKMLAGDLGPVEGGA